MHTLPEGAEQSPASGFANTFGRVDEALQYAAVFCFELCQTGKDRSSAQKMGIPGKNAGNEGSDKVPQHLRPEAASYKFGDGFFMAVRIGFGPGLAQDLHLGPRRQQTCREQPGRPHRSGVKTATIEDVTRQPAAGCDQFAVQPDVVDERDDFGRILKTVRTRLAQEAALGSGLHHAAEAIRHLDDGHIEVPLFQAVSAGQAGYACADHNRAMGIAAHGSEGSMVEYGSVFELTFAVRPAVRDAWSRRNLLRRNQTTMFCDGGVRPDVIDGTKNLASREKAAEYGTRSQKPEYHFQTTVEAAWPAPQQLALQ